MQAVCFAAALALANTGNRIAAKIAMIVITTNSSIKVNARRTTTIIRSNAPKSPHVPDRVSATYESGKKLLQYAMIKVRARVSGRTWSDPWQSRPY